MYSMPLEEFEWDLVKFSVALDFLLDFLGGNHYRSGLLVSDSSGNLQLVCVYRSYSSVKLVLNKTNTSRDNKGSKKIFGMPTVSRLIDVTLVRGNDGSVNLRISKDIYSDFYTKPTKQVEVFIDPTIKVLGRVADEFEKLSQHNDIGMFTDFMALVGMLVRYLGVPEFEYNMSLNARALQWWGIKDGQQCRRS